MFYLEYHQAYVYLVTSQTSHCKIGISTSPASRVYELQTIANEYRLGQLTIEHCFHTPYSMMWEKFFHVLFHHRKSVGLPGHEWFSLTGADKELFSIMPDKVSDKPTSAYFWSEHWLLDAKVKSTYELQQQLLTEQD